MTPETGAYVAAWLVTACIALTQGGEPMRRTILSLAGAWALNWGYCAVTGLASPWAWFVGVDTVAALAILRHPAGKVQALVGTCFLIQIAINIGYGANLLWNGYNFDAELLRWQSDYAIGFVKLAMVLAWGLWNAKSLRNLGRYRRPAYHYRPHR